MIYKKISSLGVLVIGAILVILAIHAMQKTHEAKQNVNAVAKSSSEEPLGNIISDVLKKKVGQNDTRQIYLLVSGMSLLIGGGGTLLFFRNKDEK